MAPRHRVVFVVVCLTISPAHPAFGKSFRSENRPSPPAAQKIRTAATAVEQDTVAIRYVEGAGEDDWSLAETTHFRVFHRQSRELAGKAARVAERTRAAMLAKWFGKDGDDWGERCDLYLHETADAYSRSTGAPPSSPGHSSFSRSDSLLWHRRIDLHCDDPNMLTAVLPHEATHVVLAGMFGDRRAPRWADEGMAVLTEPRDKIDRHLRNLPRFRHDQELFGVLELMELEDYPSPEQLAAFYAQSISLVQFLSGEKGPQVFTRFVREGMEAGYEQALRHHYGWDLAELERRWTREAFGEQVSAAGRSGGGG